MQKETNIKYVLIVNDDYGRANVLKRLVAAIAPNASIILAGNAVEAEEQIRKHKLSLMVLDVTLPESEFNPDIPWDDIAKYSSRIADLYQNRYPDGKLVVMSTMLLEAPSKFPTGATLIDPTGDRDFIKLRSTVQRILGTESRSVDAATASNHAEIEPPVRHRSRIQAIRDGIFYDDPDHPRRGFNPWPKR